MAVLVTAIHAAPLLRLFRKKLCKYQSACPILAPSRRRNGGDGRDKHGHDGLGDLRVLNIRTRPQTPPTNS